MSEQHTVGAPGTSDGLWRWLVGGLVAGGILLGLLIAAYAVGYHRGQDNASSSVAAPPTTTTATRTPTTTTPAKPTPGTGAIGQVTVTPALVARGKSLFTSDGCVGCHSLTGAAGAGPSLDGIAGRSTTLDTGQTVTADDAYLERSITDPDAEIVKGYHAGIMAPAVAAHDLKAHPADVRALVAFLKSQK